MPQACYLHWEKTPHYWRSLPGHLSCFAFQLWWLVHVGISSKNLDASAIISTCILAMWQLVLIYGQKWRSRVLTVEGRSIVNLVSVAAIQKHFPFYNLTRVTLFTELGWRYFTVCHLSVRFISRTMVFYKKKSVAKSLTWQWHTFFFYACGNINSTHNMTTSTTCSHSGHTHF